MLDKVICDNKVLRFILKRGQFLPVVDDIDRDQIFLASSG